MVVQNTRTTAVSTIIIAVFNVSIVITETITNKRMSTRYTSLIDIAVTIRTKISVDIVPTAVSTVIVAVFVVGLVIAKTI